MSYSRKLNKTEQRLQSLKRQFYGKKAASLPSSSFHFTPSVSQTTITTSGSTAEGSYLKNDLLKTLILASIALGAEVLLYFSLNNGLLKF